MWYLLVDACFAIWLFLDAKKRKVNGIPWAIGALLVGPVVLPVYLAKRPLKDGEVREGGTAWNILKNFAIFWTILWAVAAIWGMAGIGEHKASLKTEAKQELSEYFGDEEAEELASEAVEAGAAIGATLGLGLIFVVWFFPMLGAIVIGFFLKKSSIVEKGPTGPLASEKKA